MTRARVAPGAAARRDGRRAQRPRQERRGRLPHRRDGRDRRGQPGVRAPAPQAHEAARESARAGAAEPAATPANSNRTRAASSDTSAAISGKFNNAPIQPAQRGEQVAHGVVDDALHRGQHDAHAVEYTVGP